MSLYRRLLQNHPLANIAFVVVLAVGFLSYQGMPREKDPEVNFNWVVITTLLPGAAAEDVEKRVTDPLESAIKNVADVRFSTSQSRENVSNILVRFREISRTTFDKRINDLRREVLNAAANELPPQAIEPRVLEVTTSNGFPTALVLVAGEAADDVLRRRARKLRDAFERFPGVDQVFATGLQDPELLVQYDPAALASRGLDGGHVADATRAWFRDVFAGLAEVDADGQTEAWLVRIIGEDVAPQRIAAIPVGHGAARTPLDSVATVSRGRSRAVTLASHEGRPAVMLAITKKSNTNTLDLLDRINAFIAAENPQLAAAGVTMMLLDDQTVVTRESITIMEQNAAIGLSLVLLICWLFLGMRIAILVAAGIPFALAGAFTLIAAHGLTINVTLLLGIVIALGMLVDDVVVVVESIYYRLQRGADAIGASIDGLREVATPVLTAVLTTMAAFLPLTLLPGIIGKFMFIIPVVVTLALAISLIEAFWMLPVHVVMQGGGATPSNSDWRARFNHRLRLKYSLTLVAALRRPLLSLGVILLLLAGAGLAVKEGLVRVQFFAIDPLRLFYINVDMPASAPIGASLREAERLEERVKHHLRPDEARNTAAYAGVRFTETEPLYGDTYGQVVVSLNPRGDDGRSVDDIIAAVRPDIEATPTPGKISFTRLSGGPPLQKPVKVRVRGDNLAELRAAADVVLDIVRKAPGAFNVVDDDIPGRPQLVLRLDREALAAANVDAAWVMRQTRLAVDGEIVAVTRHEGEKTELRVRAQQRPAADPQADPRGSFGGDIHKLLDIPLALPGPNAATTTLGALVNSETRVGKGVYKHYNLVRAITIEADLDQEVADTIAVNRHIDEQWRTRAAQFPGVVIDFSGELEDLNESLDAMKVLFVLGLGLIYLILAAQFKSYFQPLMILFSVLLTLTGVVFGLLLSGKPLTLFTLYGVIALAGIAVNSAIVLIDAANSRRDAGMSIRHAAIYAARRRVIPILITSLTTVGGLASLAFGFAGESLLWGPVAQSIVWGLLISTILTLYLTPLLYCLFMRPRRMPAPSEP